LLLQQALVDFDREPDGTLTLGQEAAHSRRRILHVSDRTGRSIIEALTTAMRRHPNIELMTNATAVDLITYPHHSPDPLDTYQPVTCHGAYIFDRTAEVIHRIIARKTILATGGIRRIYRNTTNPAGARGDGRSDGAPRWRCASPTPSIFNSIPTTLACAGRLWIFD
jgi:L-aspartate oxidase